MEELIRLDNVEDYNRLFGLKTLHPLVSVVDLSEATTFPTRFTLNYGVYALFLKQTMCGDIRYGKQTYDYQEGTITSFAPGQVVFTEMSADTRPLARGLLFHPDLIKGTALGREIKSYSFFPIIPRKRSISPTRKRAFFRIVWTRLHRKSAVLQTV